MNQADRELLEAEGWEIDCESPLELSHPDGSVATGQGALCVISDLRYENRADAHRLALQDIEATARLAQAASVSEFEKNLWGQVAKTAKEALTD